MKSIIFLFLIIPIYPVFSVSDTIPTKDQNIFEISIFSNVRDAQIFIDTVPAGKTPLVNYKLKAGIYRIKLINPGYKGGWSNDNAEKELELINDTTLNINFRFYYSFNSDPFNADLIKDDTVFGKTPFRIFTEQELTGSILFRKKNYSDFIFDLKNYNFGTGAYVRLIPLNPKSKGSSDNYGYKDRNTQFKTGRNIYAILGLGAAAFTGAVLSVNFKNTANDNYKEYLATGNPAKLDQSNTYDRNFIISLVLMQIAIGGLIYFLFFDK